MLVAVQSFGSIWTARGASPELDCAKSARRGAYYNTTGVLAGGKLRNNGQLHKRGDRLELDCANRDSR